MILVRRIMMPQVAAVAEWDVLQARTRALVPEAFNAESRVLNLLEGEWKEPGFGRHYTSAVDGRSLGRIPMLELDAARRAVKFAKNEAAEWAKVDFDRRRQLVTDCLQQLKKER